MNMISCSVCSQWNVIFDTKQKLVLIDAFFLFLQIVSLMNLILITKHHQPSILRTNTELRRLRRGHDCLTHPTSFTDLELVVITFRWKKNIDSCAIVIYVK